MSSMLAIRGARIFDGEDWHDGKALLVADGIVEAIIPDDALPRSVEVVDLPGGFLAPGFVDLQVNGGGGVMLNDAPSVGTIRRICAAHAPFGTTALLATLITDAPRMTAAALEAGAAAARAKVPGFLGLHLEGPHLSLSRKGAHDPNLIRPMQKADLDRLVNARGSMPVLMTTVAPETVTPQQVAALAGAGIVVSLGHSDAGYATARAAIEAGATQVTHLFNAMSQLQHREPGMVGAALSSGEVSAGLIADGFHVDRRVIGVALRSKLGPGRIFLVTDAMATIGTDMTEFTLNGRTIRRQDGRLTLADGTLAGADLDMISAVRFMHREIGLPREEALRMASLYPAQAVGQEHRLGRVGAGRPASFVHLSDALEVRNVWIEGKRVHQG
jgi:N-acetylglucosamine-6-phosphate deacetylase